jgi:hypothetical protein
LSVLQGVDKSGYQETATKSKGFLPQTQLYLSAKFSFLYDCRITANVLKFFAASSQTGDYFKLGRIFKKLLSKNSNKIQRILL